jgi:hypothetical protein
MLAVTEVVPLATPMETLTVTGFTVPVKLAFSASATTRTAWSPWVYQHLQEDAIDHPHRSPCDQK